MLSDITNKLLKVVVLVVSTSVRIISIKGLHNALLFVVLNEDVMKFGFITLS